MRSNRPLLPFRILSPILLLLSFHQTTTTATVAKEDLPGDDFFLLCSGGNHAQLTELLRQHPDWVHATTQDNEHCLHLAGIQGFPKVTQLFLEKGANPNIRSNPNQGLRMTPLSWNVYGNHYDNCKLLLEHGADVNADFDTVTKNGEKEKITVLDLLNMFKSPTNKDEKLEEMEQLLLKYGAKTYQELVQEGKKQ